MSTRNKFLVALSAVAVLAGVAASKSPISGLVLWFRSGPGAAISFKDLSRNKNTGTATSLVVSNSPSLVSMQETHQLTLALWIKPNSIPYEFPVLISKGGYETTGANGGYELTLNAHGDNDIAFDSGSFYMDTHQANGSLINNHLGEWIHIAYTMDTVAQTAHFYVNGQEYTNSVIETGDFAGVNFDLANDLYIGQPDPAANANRTRFDGQMRNIMIFNRALSAGDIQTIISTTKPNGDSAPPGK